MLIAIEGYDGCGKTSVAQAVADELGGVATAFPNDDTVTGPLIRSYLQRGWTVHRSFSGYDAALSATAFQALQLVNRFEKLAELRVAASSPTVTAVTARYWQSGVVYGAHDGLDARWLERVHEGMPEATLNVLLDADAEVCLSRRAERQGELFERYEGRLEPAQRLVQGYRDLWARKLAEGHAGWAWVVTDEKPLEEVVAEVVRLARETG